MSSPDPQPVVPVEAPSLAYARGFTPIEVLTMARVGGGCTFRAGEAVVATVTREPLWVRGRRRWVLGFVLACGMFNGTLVAAGLDSPAVFTAARVCLPLTLLMAGVMAWKLSVRAFDFRPATSAGPTLRLIAGPMHKRPRFRVVAVSGTQAAGTTLDGCGIAPVSAPESPVPAVLADVVPVGGFSKRGWSLRPPGAPGGRGADVREVATFVAAQVIGGVAAPPQELRLHGSNEVRGRLTSRAFRGIELALDFRPEDEPGVPRDQLLLLAFVSAWNGA